MKKYICKRKCFFRGQIWGVGDVLPPNLVSQTNMPVHFYVIENDEVDDEVDESFPKNVSPVIPLETNLLTAAINDWTAPHKRKK